MKKLVSKLWVLVMLVGALGVGIAKGRITNAVDFKASSSSVAGEATLPAGSYSVRPWSEDPSVLEISNPAGTHTVLVDTETSSSDMPAKATGVVFAKSGTCWS